MYGASSAIVVSMLTPLARRVVSRIRCLNRAKAFGAMARLTSGPAVKLNPRNFRSCGRATALPLLQLVRQDCFVDRFQQTRPETGVNAVSRVDNLLRHLVFRHADSNHLTQSRQARQENLTYPHKPG